MFLVNIVPLILLVGVLSESGVYAAGHQKIQSCDLRESIISLYDELVEYSRNNDTDATMTLVHPDAKVLIGGFPMFTGQDGLRTALKLITERASRIEHTFREVQPMDKDANYVYVTFLYDFFNLSSVLYMNGRGLFIFKKTTDGYKFYIAMINKMNLPV